VPHAEFTLVGASTPSILIWVFGATGVIGLGLAFNNAYRWLGICAVVAAVINLGFQLPMPFSDSLWIALGFAGSLIDQARLGKVAGGKLIANIVARVLIVSFYLWSSLSVPNGKNIFLTGGQIVSHMQKRELAADIKDLEM